MSGRTNSESNLGNLNYVEPSELQAMLAEAATATPQEPFPRVLGSNFGRSEPVQQSDSQAAGNIYSHLVKYLQSQSEPQGQNGSGISPMTTQGGSPTLEPATAEAQLSATINNSSLSSCVSVSVEGVSFVYQLTESDIFKVFSRYGPVTEVKVESDGSSAVVMYKTVFDANAAKDDLNGKVLSGVEGTLRVEWASGDQLATCKPLASKLDINAPCFTPLQQAVPPAPTVMMRPSAFYSQPAPFQMAMCKVPDAGDQDPCGNSGDRLIRKYTCRFEIGIENDRGFHVAKRIIGQKGCNMKRIVKVTDAKLRLRGRGSGFLEGTAKQESSEPLHLCISCKDYSGYRTAVQEVTKLLEEIYDEYRIYCSENCLPTPDLAINLREHPLLSSTARKYMQTSVPSDFESTSMIHVDGFNDSAAMVYKNAVAYGSVCNREVS